MTASVRGNVPTPASSFVGRSAELAELAELASRPGLATLWGPPGVGKSRLASEVARRVPAGTDVCWVELAPLADDSGVLDAVGRAAGVHEHPERTLLDGVVAQFDAGPALLVLDNCEHVLEACSALAKTLCSRCPALTVLATSREPLHADGEHCWPVPALPAHDSADLFYVRASAGAAGFAVDDASSDAVRTICDRLQGVPLAIELAAGRTDVLSPVEIAARLDTDPLDVLGGGNREPNGHHETLRASLDWSYALLTPAEQVVLQRLSVFRGGCAPGAARTVCDGAPVSKSRIPSLLRSLADKALIVHRKEGRRTRYSLLDTVASYAQERLRAAYGIDELLARHAAWCADLAEATEPGLTGSDQLTALATIDAEYPNVSAAFTYALEHAPEAALRIAASLTVWFKVRGRYREGHCWLTSALEQDPGAGSALQAKALWGVGFLSLMVRDFPRARAAAEASLALSNGAKDGSGSRARALMVLGAAGLTSDRRADVLGESARLAGETGDNWCAALALTATAVELFDTVRAAEIPEMLGSAATVARETNDLQGMVSVLDPLSRLLINQTRFAEAESVIGQTEDSARRLGDSLAVSSAKLFLAEIAFWRSELDTAKTLLHQSLALRRRIAVGTHVAEALNALGFVTLAQGDPARAEQRFAEAISAGGVPDQRIQAARGLALAARSEGDLGTAQRLLDEALAKAWDRDSRFEAAAALAGLAAVAQDAGDMHRALALRKRALGLWWEIGVTRGFIDALDAVGRLLVESGNYRGGARLLGASVGIRAERGYSSEPHQKRVAKYDRVLRHGLTPKDFQRIWLEGAAMPPERALVRALKTNPRGVPNATGWARLTGAEQEVARLVGTGCSNPEIAQRLDLSRYTVEKHMTSAFRKLGLSSRRALGKYAVRSARPALELAEDR